MKFWSALVLFFLCFGHSYADEVFNRQQSFLKQLEKEKDDTSKITKAEKIARDVRSKYRIDAINYLIDKASVSSGSVLADLTTDPQVQDFAIFGVGELGVYEATPMLIKGLSSANRNVRGNAYRALKKLYPTELDGKPFEFHHDDPDYIRKKTVNTYERWWKDNHTIFQDKQTKLLSPEDKQKALERWEKYGKQYLDR